MRIVLTGKSVISSSTFVNEHLRAIAWAMKIALDVSGVTPLRGRVSKAPTARSMPIVTATDIVTCAPVQTLAAQTRIAVTVHRVLKVAVATQQCSVRIANSVALANAA